MILWEGDAPEGHPGQPAYTCKLSYSIVVSHLSFNFLHVWCYSSVSISMVTQLVWICTWWTSRTVPVALTEAAQLRADWISSCCFRVNVHNHPSWATSRKECMAWLSSRPLPSLWFQIHYTEFFCFVYSATVCKCCGSFIFPSDIFLFFFSIFLIQKYEHSLQQCTY